MILGHQSGCFFIFNAVFGFWLPSPHFPEIIRVFYTKEFFSLLPYERLLPRELVMGYSVLNSRDVLKSQPFLSPAFWRFKLTALRLRNFYSFLLFELLRLRWSLEGKTCGSLVLLFPACALPDSFCLGHGSVSSLGESAFSSSLLRRCFPRFYSTNLFARDGFAALGFLDRSAVFFFPHRRRLPFPTVLFSLLKSSGFS